MSWLGQNGASREDFMSLSDAYASMYAPKEEEQEQLDEGLNPFKKPTMMDKAKQLDRLMKQAKDPMADTTIKREAFEAWYENQLELGADFSEFTIDEVAEYFGQEVLEEGSDPIKQALESDKKLMKLHTKDKPAPKGYVKEEEILSALADAYGLMYEKKKDSDKCGDDTYWDKEEKKCKSKKKSSKTVVVRGGGYYGGGHHHGGSDGGDGGDTDGGDGGDGGEGGGGGE